MRPLRWLALIICAAFGVVGCSPTQAYVAARKTETLMSTAVMDAYAGWRHVDDTRQRQIMNSAATLDAAKVELAKWRAQDQAPTDKAFKDARDALYAYSQALDAADAAKQKDFGAVLGHAIGAFTALGELLARYGLKLSSVGL